MPYVAYTQYFPKSGEKETKWIINRKDPRFPPGEYILTELYCDECDCRRVVINVLEFETMTHVASISYGWGTRAFYIRWFGSEDDDILDAMMGVSLMEGGAHQDKHSEGLLQMVDELFESDPEYVTRLRSHYSKFRKKIKQLRKKGGRLPHEINLM